MTPLFQCRVKFNIKFEDVFVVVGGGVVGGDAFCFCLFFVLFVFCLVCCSF